MSSTTHRLDSFASFTGAYLPVADSSEFLMQVDRALSVALGEEQAPRPAEFSFRVTPAWQDEQICRKTEAH
jgi:hypothetical protein